MPALRCAGGGFRGGRSLRCGVRRPARARCHRGRKGAGVRRHHRDFGRRHLDPLQLACDARRRHRFARVRSRLPPERGRQPARPRSRGGLPGARSADARFPRGEEPRFVRARRALAGLPSRGRRRDAGRAFPVGGSLRRPPPRRALREPAPPARDHDDHGRHEHRARGCAALPAHDPFAALRPLRRAFSSFGISSTGSDIPAARESQTATRSSRVSP